MTFIEGATLAHHTGDRAAKRAQVAAALDDFDAEFLQPSADRRRRALSQLADGSISEEDLPADVLTVLLRNLDDLQLPPDVVLRETCFYLLAGAHTSATAFVRTVDAVFTATHADPAALERVSADRDHLQRCVHETIRLQPSSPVAMRWALDDVELGSGRRIRRGDKVVVDLMAANRDPSVFGDDADRFDPDRQIGSGAPRWGLSFGSGMHACIGQELAAGPSGGGPDDDARDEQLRGLVTIAVQALLGAGARPDPDDPPRLDPESARGYWASYPVRFGATR
jgi:cytochrome P450